MIEARLADFEGDVLTAADGGDLEQGAHRLGDTAAPADHAAHVVLADVQPDDEAVAVPLFSDVDGVLIADDEPHHVLDQVGVGRGLGCERHASAACASSPSAALASSVRVASASATV